MPWHKPGPGCSDAVENFPSMPSYLQQDCRYRQLWRQLTAAKKPGPNFPRAAGCLDQKSAGDEQRVFCLILLLQVWVICALSCLNTFRITRFQAECSMELSPNLGMTTGNQWWGRENALWKHQAVFFTTTGCVGPSWKKKRKRTHFISFHHILRWLY